MTTIQLNANKIVGDMKLMNAVNNGPTRPMKTQTRGNSHHIKLRNGIDVVAIGVQHFR